MKEHVKEYNILIKYRNSVLKSKGIDPEMYFIILEFFNHKYVFLQEGIYLKSDVKQYGWVFAEQSDVIKELSVMFALKKLKVREIILQLKTDKLLYNNLVEESVVKNWIFITVPDTSYILDDLPF